MLHALDHIIYDVLSGRVLPRKPCAVGCGLLCANSISHICVARPINKDFRDKCVQPVA